MFNIKTAISICAMTGLMVCATTAQAKQFYKWVDAKGSTHYSMTPPPKGAKNIKKVSTFNDQPRATQVNTAPSPTAAPTTPDNTLAPTVAMPQQPSQQPSTTPAAPTINDPTPLDAPRVAIDK